jgi:aspartyl/asparaginyl beta-hydroxylase (cupin superfamily)
MKFKKVFIIFAIIAGVFLLISEKDRRRPDREVIPSLNMYYKSANWVTAPINQYIEKHVPQPRDRCPFPDMESNFPSHHIFKENWQNIRNEVLQLYRERGMSEIKDDLFFRKIADKNWKKFYIKWYDNTLPDARKRLPFTTKLVESNSQVQSAMISVLEPGAIIKPHVGPFRGALRYHLGLKTPQSDACRIFVDGKKYSWRDGEDVLFDDTFVHEVKNETDKPRFILFVDVKRKVNTPVSKVVLNSACKIAKVTGKNRKN